MLALVKGAHREKDFLTCWSSSLSPKPSNLYPVAIDIFYHSFLKITTQSSWMKRTRFTLKWDWYFYPLILRKELPEVCAITEMLVSRGLGCSFDGSVIRGLISRMTAVPSWRRGAGPDHGRAVLATLRTVAVGHLAWVPSWPSVIQACAI